jgi:RimJ/RimL family protein N-acetyltransferase
MDLVLRELGDDDVAAIHDWPPYAAEFGELDYALRHTGWLCQFRQRSDCFCFAADQAGELIAFTILAQTAADEAEFRIALRGDRTGQGLGGPITSLTLARGFFAHGFARIHLIVRHSHQRALALYRRLGFVAEGECCKKINGQEVRCHVMALTRHKSATHFSDEIPEGRRGALWSTNETGTSRVT